MCQTLDKNAKVTTATPIFGGGWIRRIYDYFEMRSHRRFHHGLLPLTVDLDLLRSMDMIADLPGGMIWFKSRTGEIWDPEDPARVILELPSIPHHQQPPQPQGPPPHASPPPHYHDQHEQHDPFFMQGILAAIQQNIDLTQRTFSLAETTHERVEQIDHRVTRIDGDVQYMRGMMYDHWGNPRFDGAGSSSGGGYGGSFGGGYGGGRGYGRGAGEDDMDDD
jgi:hypothetical protein